MSARRTRSDEANDDLRALRVFVVLKRRLPGQTRPRGLFAPTGGSGFGDQFLFLTAELLAEFFQLLAVEFAARAGKAGAFLFVDVVIDQLAKHGELRGPLLAGLVAGARHLR